MLNFEGGERERMCERTVADRLPLRAVTRRSSETGVKRREMERSQAAREDRAEVVAAAASLKNEYQ